LAAAGIQIDYRDFVIDSRSLHAKVLLIDKTWKGDPQILRWLRWVKDVENAVIEGDAVRHEVIVQVVRMPALRSIVMREATLRDDVIGPLSTLSRIDQLEFRYIPLTVEDAEKIAKLPLRVSLSLMGTGLPVEGAKMLRTAVPGIKLAYKQGGFLGVICNQFSARCQVDNVKPGSAAAMAGIEAGDVVIQIGDAKINSFDDLQLQVGSHYAGDEIEITYDRFGEIIKTKARLGRLDNE
jgi:membrane-associated protease RseP (regulator of RpoE activity)